MTAVNTAWATSSALSGAACGAAAAASPCTEEALDGGTSTSCSSILLCTPDMVAVGGALTVEGSEADEAVALAGSSDYAAQRKGRSGSTTTGRYSACSPRGAAGVQPRAYG